MLKALNDMLDRALGAQTADTPPEERRHGVQLATAVLLVEMARADFEEDITADAAVLDLLKSHFDLSEPEAALLVEEARSEADYAASLQSFTRQLHEQLTLEEKRRVVEMLWRVALADRHLDKHEDYLVRKVADLLYVPHSDLIRIRNRVKEGV